MKVSKCTPNGPSTLASASLVEFEIRYSQELTKSRKSGGRGGWFNTDAPLKKHDSNNTSIKAEQTDLR